MEHLVLPKVLMINLVLFNKCIVIVYVLKVCNKFENYFFYEYHV